jgi:predicted nucleotidyltransferase
MDKQTVKELKLFFSKIRKPKIEKIILFGSRAADDYLINSDADVILVSHDFSGVPFPKRGTDLYLKWRGSAPLEMLCFTPEEFDKKTKQIGTVSDALSHGIELFPK